MKLLIDIGNSYIKCGLFDKDHIREFISFKTSNDISFTSFKNHKIDKVIISSVVKKMTPLVIKEVKKITKAKIIDIVNLKKKIKINVKAKNEEIGSDLYADLIATKKKYKGPAIIFDIGTVSKVLALDKNDTFIGASFFASSSSSTKALFSHTEALPKINLRYSTSPLGKDTDSCINNGVIYSLIYAIKGFIKDYQKILGKNVKVIITGGEIYLIKKYLKNVIYNPYLTLLGAYYIEQGE